MEEHLTTPDVADEGIPLIEGWTLGALFYPVAMEVVAAFPPANDTAPAE